MVILAIMQFGMQPGNFCERSYATANIVDILIEDFFAEIDAIYRIDPGSGSHNFAGRR